MAAIVGAIAAVGALIVLLLRRLFRWGEPGTVDEESGEHRR